MPLSGLIMIGVIIASRKVGINPDNVATPIAASLGDLITLSLLAGISTGLYKELGNTGVFIHLFETFFEVVLGSIISSITNHTAGSSQIRDQNNNNFYTN